MTAEAAARRFRLASPGMALALGALTLSCLPWTCRSISPLLAGVVAWEPPPCWLAFSGWWLPGASQPIPSGGCCWGMVSAALFYDVASDYAVLDYHFHRGDLPLARRRR